MLQEERAMPMIVTVLGIKQICTKDDTFWIHNYSLNGRDEDYVIAQSWFFFFTSQLEQEVPVYRT